MDIVVSHVILHLTQVIVSASLGEAKFLYRRQVVLPRMTVELRKEFEQLEGFLGDAQKRQEEDPVVRKWMSEVVDLTSEVEDLTEKYLARIMRRRQNRRGRCNPLNAIEFLGDMIVFGREVSRIHGLTEKISQLNFKMRSYGIIHTVRSEGSPSTERVIVVNGNDEILLIGLDEDMVRIENELVYEENTKVIAICGTNGLGKTTLIREVLHRSTIVKEHFNAIAWVNLGPNAGVAARITQVLRQILLDLEGHQREVREADELSRLISQVLKEKKCLVVLDDLQTPDTWDLLEDALGSIRSDSSSKLVVTTCDAKVLTSLDRHGFLHQLRCLNSEDRWKLLQSKISTRGYVEKLHKHLAENCGGLPLAIHVLGGVIANEGSFAAHWSIYAAIITSAYSLVERRNVWKKHSVLSDFLFGSKGEVGIVQVLELSYKTLPKRLKLCLLEMVSTYPLGSEIGGSELINLWIDRNIVRHRIPLRAEVAAQVCLDELVKRSLILVVGKDRAGKIMTCQLPRPVQHFYHQILNTPPPSILSRVIHFIDTSKLSFGVHHCLPTQ